MSYTFARLWQDVTKHYAQDIAETKPWLCLYNWIELTIVKQQGQQPNSIGLLAWVMKQWWGVWISYAHNMAVIIVITSIGSVQSCGHCY